jgi:hypothetical protein
VQCLHNARSPLQGPVRCHSSLPPQSSSDRCPDTFRLPVGFRHGDLDDGEDAGSSPDSIPLDMSEMEGARELVYVRPIKPEPLKEMEVLEGIADDPLLANPLERLRRLGTEWFGVIIEFEAVLVESAHEDHVRAWQEVCSIYGKPSPMQFQLAQAEGMKAEQVRHAMRSGWFG